MKLFIQLWQKISYLGIKEDSSIIIQRQIILSNQVSIILFPLILTSAIIQALGFEQYIKFLMGLPMLLFLPSVPLFNSWNKTSFARSILATILPLYLLIINVLNKYLAPEHINLAEYIIPNFILMITVVIPMILFDFHQERKRFLFSISCSFLIMISFDFWNNLFGVGIKDMGLFFPAYPLIAYMKVIYWLIIVFCFTFLRNINTLFERKIQETNQVLNLKNYEISAQHQEILAQNEELYQNQEEILTQREFIEHKNLQLEERNRQINSSIKAALTIQKAILPYQEKLDSLLKNYFILNRPKDVVSGDFYWLNQVNQQTILVVADCTGHGVPGAFMTLIGVILLDKIVRVWQITSPAEIFTRLHEEISLVLRQEHTSNNNGMDAVVIAFTPTKDEKNTLEFCGAKNAMFIYQSENQEVREVKGDRRAIGGLQNEAIPFTNQVFTLQTNDILYLGSDGFEDQNDKSRQRYGKKRLMQILQQNAHQPMDTQKQLLEADLQDFMQSESNQRDDILLLGFQV